MWVKDKIGETYKNWSVGDLFLIEAPTGSGKTSFVFESLLPFIEGTEKCLVYFCNRNLLKDQIKSIYENSGKILEENDQGFLQSGNFFICNYQAAEVRGKIPPIENDGIVYYVFDEAHYFVHDSTFNDGTNFWSDALNRCSANGVCIFMTATSTELEVFLSSWTISDLIGLFNRVRDAYKQLENKKQSLEARIDTLEEDRSLWEKLPNSHNIEKMIKRTEGELKELCKTTKTDILIEKYKEKAQNSAKLSKIVINQKQHDFTVNYYKEDDELVDLVSDLQAVQPEDRWLIFVENKDSGYELLEAFLRKGLDAVFITSSNVKKARDCMAKKMYDEIKNSSRFSCKILISTSVMDNGVNIIDPTVRNIVMAIKDKSTFLQMFGRKRWTLDDEGCVKVFLKFYDRKSISNQYNYFQLALRFVEDFWKLNDTVIYEDDENVYIRRAHVEDDAAKRVSDILKRKKQYPLMDSLLVNSRRRYGKHDTSTDIKLSDYVINRTALLNVLNNVEFYYQLFSRDADSKDPNFFLKEQLGWLGKEYTETAWLDYSNRQETTNKILNMLERFFIEHCEISKEEIGLICKQILEWMRCGLVPPENYQASRYSHEKFPGITKVNNAFKAAHVPYKIVSKQKKRVDKEKREQVYYIEKY